MKKRIISAILAICLCASIVTALTINTSAGTTGLSKALLLRNLSDFIGTAKSQIPRDDYENMPDGMNTISPATVKLQSQLDTANALRKRQSEQGIETEIENFLLEIFDGWDAEKGSFKDANKPYGDFQNALYLRNQAMDNLVAKGDKGYQNLNRGEYTIESWRNLAAAVAAIVDTEYSATGLPLICTMTRSDAWKLITAYMDAYDKLEKITGDVEVNTLKQELYLNLMTKETVNIIDLVHSTPFNFELIDIASASQENPNAPATIAYKAWVNGAWDAYNDENATVEELRKYVDDNYYLRGEYDEEAFPDGYDTVVESPDELDDEAFAEKYGKKASRIVNYVAIRDDQILTFRNSIYVGAAFKNDLKALSSQVSYDKELGYYTSADYAQFTSVCENATSLANDYLTTDLELREQYKLCKAAFDLLLTKKQTVKLYEVIHTNVMNLYNTRIKGYESLFYEYYINVLYAAMDDYDKALAAYDEYVNDGGQDATKLDRLYQNLMGSAYYLEQSIGDLILSSDNKAVKPEAYDPNTNSEEYTGGETEIKDITLEEIYNSASTMYKDAYEFDCWMTDALDMDGAYPYKESTLNVFWEKYRVLETLVTTYETETENGSTHSATKDDFINAMLDLIQAQLSLENVKVNTCND